MAESRLEVLSRCLATGPSRRAVLGGLGGLGLGGLLHLPHPVAAQEAEEGWVEIAGLGICRLPRFPCTRDSQCCAGGCQDDGTCGCRKRGRTAFRKALCCSGKKKRGDKGKCR